MVDLGDDLHSALERADFVSIHTPLTPDTHHLIDADALARMKPTAILVNTARGPIVDQDALAAALSEGRLAGAGLDVTDPEPLPPDAPALRDAEPARRPPHRLGHHTARAAMADRAVDNLLAALDGKPMPYAVPGRSSRDARRRRRHRHELDAPARRGRRRRRRADRAPAPLEGDAPRRPPRADGRSERGRHGACSRHRARVPGDPRRGGRRADRRRPHQRRARRRQRRGLPRARARPERRARRARHRRRRGGAADLPRRDERARGRGRDADARHRRRRRLDRARRGQRRRGELPRLDAGGRRPPHRAPPRDRPADAG